MTKGRMPASFYTIEIVARVLLAFAAFQIPINLLTNDVRIYWQHARDISPSHLPYADFLWEYPPLSILPLLYLPLTGRTSLGFHLLFVPTMILFEYGSLCLIRRAKPENFVAITAYWSAVVVPISMLVWYRFDYMSIFFATIAMLAIESNKPVVLPMLLGFLSKLWPIFLGVVLFARGQFKKTAMVLITCIAATFAWWLITPDGFHTFLRYRQGEGFQIESIPGSLLLLFTGRHVFYTYGALNISDAGLHSLQAIMNALSILGPVAFALIAYKTKRRNDVALMAGTVAFVLCVDRLISAQFVVWLAPFIAFMWPTYKRLGYVYGLVILLTDIVIVTYNPLWRHNRALDAVLVGRNIVLVWLTYELLRAAFRPAVRTEPKYSNNNTTADSDLNIPGGMS